MGKWAIVLLLWCCLWPSRIWGQTASTQLANAFLSLGNSPIYNELMIVDETNPKLVVLFAHGADVSIELFSMSHGGASVAWHLHKLPATMAVFDPANLRIVNSGQGPVITLHGCAIHLCGGKGLAGAFAYFIDTNHIYNAVGNWDSKTGKANISLSADIGPISEAQRRLLQDLLHEEGY